MQEQRSTRLAFQLATSAVCNEICTSVQPDTCASDWARGTPARPVGQSRRWFLANQNIFFHRKKSVKGGASRHCFCNHSRFGKHAWTLGEAAECFCVLLHRYTITCQFVESRGLRNQYTDMAAGENRERNGR